jgi:hypothetical protein
MMREGPVVCLLESRCAARNARRKILRSSPAREGTGPSFGEKTNRIKPSEQINQQAYNTGPAGLMASANSGTVVAVEVFVERNVVAQVGVGLELFRGAVDRSTARSSRRNVLPTARQFAWPPRKGSSAGPSPLGTQFWNRCRSIRKSSAGSG